MLRALDSRPLRFNIGFRIQCGQTLRSPVIILTQVFIRNWVDWYPASSENTNPTATSVQQIKMKTFNFELHKLQLTGKK